MERGSSFVSFFRYTLSLLLFMSSSTISLFIQYNTLFFFLFVLTSSLIWFSYMCVFITNVLFSIPFVMLCLLIIYFTSLCTFSSFNSLRYANSLHYSLASALPKYFTAKPFIPSSVYASFRDTNLRPSFGKSF